MTATAISIVAPSSPMPQADLQRGVAKMRKAGWDVRVHKQCAMKHEFYAGEDSTRTSAFWECARDTTTRVLWSARGGYGSARLLPELERLTRVQGVPPRKLWVGYSDATAIAEFVRRRWGWPTLQAEMPGLAKFSTLKPAEWKTTCDWVERRVPANPWGRLKLRELGRSKGTLAMGEMTGGNLSVLASLVGTDFEAQLGAKIVFIEDVAEPFYKLDRMMQQLKGSMMRSKPAAIVLGNFLDCEDRFPPKLRPAVTPARAWESIFGSVGDELGIPVWTGLPVGHGPAHFALPTGGARYELGARGEWRFLDWPLWLK